MSQLATTSQIDPGQTLTKAFLNAGKDLGLSRAALGQVIGKDRSTLTRGQIAPDSKAGELALMLVRCYRALFVLVGGEPAQMQHWMHTPNHHTGGIPAEQVLTVQGLVQVTEYLDAMRGKI
jgi:hypothetical protein